jgi:hypothetical protein
VRFRYVALAAVALAACGKNDLPPHAVETVDAAAEPIAEEAPPPPPPRVPIRVGAANFQVSVLDRMEWPETGNGARRLGYLRHGAVVDAYEGRVVNDECTDGWYELVHGGYVCGKAVTPELKNPRVRLAPKQPDRDAGMPYRYGVNLSDGTPLYRRVLAADDRKKYERPPEVAKPVSLGETAKADPAKEPGASETSAKAASPERSESAEKSGAEESGSGALAEEETSAARAPTAAAASSAQAGTLDAGSEKPDAGKPKLKDLKGRGVLVRRMARGFYVALDRDFKAAGARWWRTTFGFAVPYERIMLQPERTKHVGSWFSHEEPIPFVTEVEDGAELADADAGAGESLAGVVGFVLGGAARRFDLKDDGKKITAVWGPALPKRSSVLLTGEKKVVSGATLHAAAGGFWVRLSDLKLAHVEPPADLAPGEKWIDVDLTRQTLVAFEGTRPVFGTLISSGRRNTFDKERDFPTPTGTFRIQSKHVTTTMDGDVAADGPYSIEDVPWVMYFQGSYAIHGAFWHDSFGRPRSHGCLNLSPEDARALFAWSEPALPEAWHGVFAKDESAGSRVVVHEDPQPKRR